VDLSAISGMSSAMYLLDQTASSTASFAAGPDQVDLPTQVTNLMRASLAYDVNARVMDAQKANLQAAVDMIA
jgi:flagellar basal body rod protein FlgC